MILVRDAKGKVHAVADAYERRQLHYDSSIFCRLYVVRSPLFGDRPTVPTVEVARLMLDVGHELEARSNR